MEDNGMGCDDSRLNLVAFQLATSGNQRARRAFGKSSFGVESLPILENNILKSLGFKDGEIKNIRHNYISDARKEIDRAGKKGIHLVFPDEKIYPHRLSEIYDPPKYLYVMGNKEALSGKHIGIVGSRKGGSYGHDILKGIIPDLVQVDLTIVSGMAYGVDSMAHSLTLGSGGKTIGVNAGGLDFLYPAGNRGLISEITKDGCVISEFPMETKPLPHHFPIRNRIISGISNGVMVVEAAIKSGSLITARLAMEQNRDVFAIPGDARSPLSQGPHYLIQQGAKLVTGSADVLEEFGFDLAPAVPREKFPLSKKEKKILDLMEDYGVKSIDYFVESLGYSPAEVISLIMGLILKNLVIDEPGGYKRING